MEKERLIGMGLVEKAMFQPTIGNLRDYIYQFLRDGNNREAYNKEENKPSRCKNNITLDELMPLVAKMNAITGVNYLKVIDKLRGRH